MCHHNRTLTITFCLFIGLCAAVSEARDLNGFEISGSLIPEELILSGGPPRDGIPALTFPAFVAPSKASFMGPRDELLGVVLQGGGQGLPHSYS